MKYNNGFTVIEMIVYVALLGFAIVFLANSFIQISDTYNRARAERDVLSNSRLMLETMNRTIEQSKSVYGPTSKFFSNSGQLSLVTPVNPPLGHTAAYVDFYLDNGRLWEHQEGQATIPISSAGVVVNILRFERIMQGLNRDAVKVTIQVTSTSPKFPVSMTLTSTKSLRGTY